MTNEELVKYVQAGDNEKDYMLQLWKQNYGLINMLVIKYGTKSEYEDLTQEAFIGLYTAAMKFVPSRNVLFITYAYQWVRHYIVRYMQNNVSLVRIPVHSKELIIKYKKITNDFEMKYSRKPSEEEIMNLLNIDGGKLDNLQYLSSGFDIHSLNEPIDGESDLTIESCIQSDVDTEADVSRNLDHKKMQKQLWDTIERLPKKALEVMKKRYQDGLSQKETGNKIGVSERQISHIESNVRRKIRTSPSCIGLKEYYVQYLQ